MFLNSPKVWPILVRLIMSCTMKLFKGGKDEALSFWMEAAKPPAPKVMTGPKIWSRVTLIITSRASRCCSMGCTVMPLMWACGANTAARSMMLR